MSLTVLAKRLAQTLSGGMAALAPYIPYTRPYYVRAASLEVKPGRALDVGCAHGASMAFLRKHGRFYAVGADLFLPVLKRARAGRVHNDYVLCDARHLPFRDRSFDVVLCLEVLEHVPKQDGERVLDELERVAGNRVVLSMPVGRHVQHAPRDGNPYDEHVSEWHPWDLARRGYRVHTFYIRNTGGELFEYRLPTLLWPLWLGVKTLAGVVTSRFPNLAGHMVCVKEMPGVGEARSQVLEEAHWSKPSPSRAVSEIKRREIEIWNIKGPVARTTHDAPFLRATSERTNAYLISLLNASSVDVLRQQEAMVLDCGCGAGFLLQDLVRHFHTVFGLDISWESLRSARDMLSTTPISRRLVAGDASSLPFGDKVFDLIIMRSVLHHVPDADQAVQELRRVLKPRGLVVLNEPCSDSSIMRSAARRFSRERFFSSDELEGLFAEGFELLDRRRVSYGGFAIRHTCTRLWVQLRYPPALWAALARLLVTIDELWSGIPILNRLNLGMVYLLRRSGDGSSLQKAAYQTELPQPALRQHA